ALPAGALSDRFGPRMLTLCSGGLMAAALLIQAVAPAFPSLLISRLVFGLGFGTIWTAGISWLAGAGPGGASLGGSVGHAGGGGAGGRAGGGAGGRSLASPPPPPRAPHPPRRAPRPPGPAQHPRPAPARPAGGRQPPRHRHG